MKGGQEVTADSVRLWTSQPAGFSIVTGTLDPKRSRYNCDTVPNYLVRRGELAHRLGTDRFLWCSTVRPVRYVQPVDPEVEWELEVPTAQILKFMDDIVWNRILGLTCDVPERRKAWKKNAWDRFHDDADAYDRYMAEQREAFWNQAPPGGSWWNALFVEPQVGETITALIPFPVHKEWIIAGIE